MLQTIRNLLLRIANNIDSGNSNLSEDEMLQVVNALR